MTMPSNMVHSISPEAVEAFNDIYIKNNIFIGWPASADKQLPGYSHFQLLKTNDKYINSIEIQSNTDGSFCAYAGYYPDKMPYWYDTFDAIEQDSIDLPLNFSLHGRFDFTAHREWANDFRNLGDVWSSNWNPTSWPSTHPTVGGGVSPYPPGRGPTPQWVKTCADPLGNFPLENTPPRVQNAGKYCDYKSFDVGTFITGGVLEWCPIDPPVSYAPFIGAIESTVRHAA